MVVLTVTSFSTSFGSVTSSAPAPTNTGTVPITGDAAQVVADMDPLVVGIIALALGLNAGV